MKDVTQETYVWVCMSTALYPLGMSDVTYWTWYNSERRYSLLWLGHDQYVLRHMYEYIWVMSYPLGMSDVTYWACYNNEWRYSFLWFIAMVKALLIRTETFVFGMTWLIGHAITLSAVIHCYVMAWLIRTHTYVWVCMSKVLLLRKEWRDFIGHAMTRSAVIHSYG